MVSAEVIPERQRSMGGDALAVLLAVSTVTVGLMAVLLCLRLLSDGRPGSSR